MSFLLVLKQSEFRKLFLYEPLEQVLDIKPYATDDCSICLNEFGNNKSETRAIPDDTSNDKVGDCASLASPLGTAGDKPEDCVVFKCGHVFHIACCERVRKNECPTCRQVVPLKDFCARRHVAVLRILKFKKKRLEEGFKSNGFKPSILGACMLLTTIISCIFMTMSILWLNKRQEKLTLAVNHFFKKYPRIHQITSLHRMKIEIFSGFVFFSVSGYIAGTSSSKLFSLYSSVFGLKDWLHSPYTYRIIKNYQGPKPSNT